MTEDTDRQIMALAALAYPGDELPITIDWLKQMGFSPVPSRMGPNYDDHWEITGREGTLNIWEHNRPGQWLFDDADWIELRSRGELRMLCHLARVTLGEPSHG